MQFAQTLQNFLKEEKGLTKMEARLCEALIFSGATNVSLGTKFEIKEGSVKMHFTNVYKKFAVQSRNELMLVLFKCNDECLKKEKAGEFLPGYR